MRRTEETNDSHNYHSIWFMYSNRNLYAFVEGSIHVGYVGKVDALEAQAMTNNMDGWNCAALYASTMFSG